MTYGLIKKHQLGHIIVALTAGLCVCLCVPELPVAWLHLLTQRQRRSAKRDVEDLRKPRAEKMMSWFKCWHRAAWAHGRPSTSVSWADRRQGWHLKGAHRVGIVEGLRVEVKTMSCYFCTCTSFYVYKTRLANERMEVIIMVLLWEKI